VDCSAPGHAPWGEEKKKKRVGIQGPRQGGAKVRNGFRKRNSFEVPRERWGKLRDSRAKRPGAVRNRKGLESREGLIKRFREGSVRRKDERVAQEGRRCPESSRWQILGGRRGVSSRKKWGEMSGAFWPRGKTHCGC